MIAARSRMVRLRVAVALAIGCAVGCAGRDSAWLATTSSETAVVRPQAPVEASSPPRSPAVGFSPSASAPTAVVPLGSPSTPVIPAALTPADDSSLVAASAFRPNPATADTQLRVVAVIGTDSVITDDEVWQMVRQRANEYIKLTGSDREAREKELFRESLRSLIDRELILADFLSKLKKNKPELIPKLEQEAKQSAEKELKRFRKLNNIPSEAEFAQALRQQGMSLKGLQRQIERKSMVDIYLGQLMREKKASITLAEVVQYYQRHPEEFRVEDSVDWLDLFVSFRRLNTPEEARRYAQQLRLQAQAGADFVELVKQYGHGDSVLRQGEGIGHKRGEIHPRELEETLFTLQENQVSELIPTETGYHIVKVTRRVHAGIRPFDQETQAAIRSKLAGQIAQQEYQRIIEDLWRKTTVRIVELP